MPKIRTVGDIKSKLLHPALTSHFEVEIPKPLDVDGKFKQFLEDNRYQDNSVLGDQLNLMCSEAILPGSNLATLELSSNYTGVTERHAYRRIYDNNIDFTFYVDADKYLPIKYFEIWMKFIVDESVEKQNDKGVGSKDSNYFYRVRYPKDYMCQSGLKVTKFERTGNGKSYTGSTLIYNFVNAFPISVFSMPVSYESSSLLKCTVSFSYIRYYIDFKESEIARPEKNINSTPTPTNTAQFNTDQFKGIDYSTFSTSEASKKIGFSNKVETQEQYYNRIYGEA
jgi:hypothetical protein